MSHVKKPRCFLVYALAPEGLSPAQVNQIFNAYIGDRRLPLVLFHDHFIGQLGGLAIFYAETEAEREALYRPDQLEGWEVKIHPLIYSDSPAGFDEQTAFTLRAYRGINWEQLRHEKRPRYGDPNREAETGEEHDEDE
jgi:hypothetical protein